MIQKLRRKFIATNMLLVSIVLLCVFGVQTFSAYRRAGDEVYRANLQALEWVLRTEVPKFEFVPRQDGEPPQGPLRQKEGRQRRYFNFIPAFAVEVDEDMTVVSVQAGPGSTITEENAQALVDQALRQSSGHGTLPSHGTLPGQTLSYLCLWADGDRLLDAGVVGQRQFFAFADNSSVGQTLRNQLLVSLLISAAALLAFFLISRFLAKVAVGPIERAWEQQRQFVADASHELKTPLAVILANTDIVAAHPAETVESQGKWIGYIREEAQRMRSLVEDLLFLAKSDAQKLPLHPTQVRLSELVTGSLLPFESVAFEAGVTLADRVSPGVTLTGDEAQLRRLVVILMDNAVKYAGPGGTVTVTLDRAQDRPRLTVHNTGPAIPAEHLPHLFERFYRADTARDREQGGYGLGLSIAQSITEAHGGRITVSSSPDAGTAFTVLFPKK